MLVIKDIQEITTNVISNLVDYHKTNLLPRYKKLNDYYKAKHDILNKTVSDSSKPNNKLVNDYPGYITNMATGYFIGRPVTYSSKSKDDTYLKTLQDIFDYNDEADENNELAKICSITGEAFELLFQDEDANTRFAQIPNEQIIVIYNTKIVPTIRLAIRYYEVTALDKTVSTKIEVYDKDKTYYYTQNGKDLNLDSEQEHFFKEVPVVHYFNNNEQIGDAERVLSLIDAYDKAQSDTMDDMDYFTDAYLKIVGASLGEGDEAKETAKTMRENRVIEIPEGGDADFLIKDINDAAIENFKKRLNTDIHKFSATPDLTDEKFGDNLSGISIKFKLFCLEQLAIMKERKFKKSLQRRIELITNILNIKGGSYVYTDIDMSFTRNIPANLTELVDMASKLKGIVSDKTLLSQLPFVSDVAAEVEKINEEQGDNLTDYTLTNNQQNGDVNG